MNKVGQRIRKFCESKGFSQDYMAMELEISQASARLESQAAKLDVIRLMKIAGILKVYVMQLLGKIVIYEQDPTYTNIHFADDSVIEQYS